MRYSPPGIGGEPLELALARDGIGALASLPEVWQRAERRHESAPSRARNAKMGGNAVRASAAPRWRRPAA